MNDIAKKPILNVSSSFISELDISDSCKRGNVINLSRANLWVEHIHVVMVFKTFSNIKNPTYPDPTVILLVPDIIA
jgi:hypothetical protein